MEIDRVKNKITKTDKEIDISKVFAEGTEIDKAIRSAVRQALRMHKLLGNPVSERRDGRVVWVPPEEINLDDPSWEE